MLAGTSNLGVAPPEGTTMTTTTITDTQMAQLAINTIRTSTAPRRRRSAWRWALLTEYGFTVEKAVAAARAQLPPAAQP
jgi:hypothetical protein